MASTSRILSNIWIREVASTISGRVLSIGSGTDADGQGNFYRSYFNKCSLYLTSEVSPASGCDLVLDVQNMSAIADSYFDCVFCSGVLEHVREPDVAIGEITRILKVGGYLLLGVPFRQSIHLPPTDYWRFTEYGLEHLLQKHGYAIEAVKAIDAEDPMFPASYWVSAKKIAVPDLKASTGYGCISTFFDQRQVLDRQHYIGKMSAFDADFKAFIHQKEILDVRKWEYCALLEAFKGNFSDKKILDVGCGRSLLSGFLSTLGAHVVTLDLPSPFQEQDDAITKRRRFGVEHVNGSMLDIPFETGTFDLVISISAIEHLQEVPSNRLQSRSYEEFIEKTIQAVKEMARVVKPGGHLFITSDLYDPLRQQDDNWRPGAGVSCAYQLADFDRAFSTPLRRAGLFFDRPFSYDFQQLTDDEGRATYRGRYFTTFACLMKKQSDVVLCIGDKGVRPERAAHEPPVPLAKPLMEFLPGQRINLVIADEGWILEQCARAIEQHAIGVKISRHPDPSAAINYYINYYAYQGPQPGIDIAFFTHVEERVPSAAERFFQVAREVDVCVCMSTFYADMLQAQGIKNILVIKPGVDLELFRPAVRIGVVGRTYPTGRKGEALLKQVMDEPGIEWHFTGEGWPGPSKHYASDQMPHFYNAMDYILVPSYYEGGPMSVLEALACGKEVIAPAVGFVPDYPHIEYAAGDAEDLRRVLKLLVAKRFTLRNSVVACSWENWAKHHHGLFRDVLAEKGNAARLLQQLGSVKGASRESSAVNSTHNQPRKLEIGSGMNPHTGYEHMDIRADLPHIEHVHDIYKPLPFAAGTFDEILSWSVVEHISWRNIKEVLTNWKKVLKPGGKLEIWVPDLEYLCTMYKEGKMDEHLDKSYIDTAQKVIGHYSPSVWAMIKMFGGQDYQENFHAAMYDWATMQQMLTFIGFQQVERIAPYHGLHVIAFKPNTELSSI